MPRQHSPSNRYSWIRRVARRRLAGAAALAGTWTTYKVNRFTGNIIWQLGGEDGSFELRAAPGQSLDNAGEIFAWQHDPEEIGHDEYTFFDNESAGTPEFPVSRAMTVKFDPSGRLVFNAEFPSGVNTYRAYVLPWRPGEFR